MMYINGIIVVEGKEDAGYLSSFIKCEYVLMNGYNIPKEEIEYLNKASNYVDLIVMMDPDKAGREIESKLRISLEKAHYLNVDISECKRGKKNGIAETNKEEILRVLKPYITDKNEDKNELLLGKITNLDVSDQKLRQYICRKFSLGICNNKKLFRRLKTLRIDEDEVLEAMEEFRSGN